ncbi:hypothetical protein [Streptomyces acidicola]|uniref:hypothetical protein n=1 Tax=Streptomyces acidicola TaxID=2596892 RepID=UPI00382A4125
MGALVGALAIGGGAYVSGIYANKAQKAQARRGVYHAFLSEVNVLEAQIAKLQDLVLYGLRDEGRGGGGGGRARVWRRRVMKKRMDAIEVSLANLGVAVSGLGSLEIGVLLEGPDSVSSRASEVTRQMSSLEARMSLAHSSGLHDDDGMRETIKRDCAELEELVKQFQREASRHL